MSKKIFNKKIILVGLGPHAKRIYYKFIEHTVSKGGDFVALIELESKRIDVEEFFYDKKIKPKSLFYIPDGKQISPKNIDIDLEIRLDDLIKNKGIDCAVIATEPKAHKVYLDYFLDHKIPCLTDKPVTAPVGLGYDEKATETLIRDVEEIISRSDKNSTPVYVQAQRREHQAYKFIFETAQKIVNDFGVPITYFDIYHSDGTWSMPGEFFSRENHPYKYGYGKMMHSGYHFVDLVAWISEINKSISPKISVKTSSLLLSPEAHYNQIDGKKLYKKVFNKITRCPVGEKLGEVDAYINFTFFEDANCGKKDKILTIGNLNLLQSGFSKRSWYKIAKDTYKGNGRVRHEYINLNIGPLCNIQLHSYQSDELNKTKLFGVGGEEHLDVFVFRNSNIIGGKPFEVIDFGKRLNKKIDKTKQVYLGQNESSRFEVFKKFLQNKQSDTIIQKQLVTNKLLSAVYRATILKEKVVCKI